MATTDNAEWTLLDTDLTTVLAILPVTKSHLYIELSEPGSGELKIPLDSVAAGLVENGMFCLCNYRGSSRGGFFVDNIGEFQADATEGGGRFMSVSGRGGLALLNDAIIWDDGTGNSTRDFTDKTKAYILKTLIDEAIARGGLAVLTYDFTAVVDSASVAWTDSETYKLNVGMSLLDLMRQFAQSGIDFDMNLSAGSFVLSAYKNGIGTDKSTTQFFRIGTNCMEVKKDEKGDEVKNALRVAYNGGYLTVSDSTSIAARRRREELLDIKQAQTSASATTYASAVLADSKNLQLGFSVQVHDGVDPKLFEDYDIGDYIKLDRFGTETKYRIYGIQADFDGVSYSNVVVELNTIMRTKSMMMANDLNWLLNQWNTAHDANLLEVSYWAALGGQDSVIDRINAILVIGTKIYVAGAINKIGGTGMTGVMEYDTLTGKWSGMGGGTNYAGGAEPRYGEVYTMATDGTYLYVGGYFATFGGIEAWNIAKFHLTTRVWSELGGGLYWNETYFWGMCCAMIVDGTDIYCAGVFDHVGAHSPATDVFVYSIAKYNTGTGVWTAIGNPGIGLAGALLMDGTTLYMVGSTTPYIKKYASATWSNVGAGLDGRGYALAQYGTSILAGGDMTGRLVEWDGVAWATFGGGLNETVRGIKVYLTDVYAVGDFTDRGNYIAVYSGGAWNVLGTGLNGATYAIDMIDSDVYVGGVFTTAGDKPALQLAVYFNNFEALVGYLENTGNSFDMAAAIHGAAASAITDADEMGFWEDVSNALRKITWANIKATIKTYADGLYVALTGDQNVAGIKTFTDSINVGSTPPVAGVDGTVNQVVEGASAGNTSWTFGTTFASFFTGIFANGTKASPTAAVDEDIMLKVRGRAHDGTTYGNTSAEIRYVADENHSNVAHGARAEIWTTPTGSTTLTKALTIGSDGNMNAEAGKTYNINGTPVVKGETNANEIFYITSPGGVSAFVGTIATLPGGATLTYNITSGQEGAMVPGATTNLGKMRLYNTARGTNALISNCVVGTNTLTFTANVPAGWQVGDTIDIASPTLAGGGGFSWVDIEITSGPTSKSYVFVAFRITSATVGDAVRISPLAAYAASQNAIVLAQVANIQSNNFGLISLTSNVFSVSWTGTPTDVVIRETGYLS